MEINIENYGKLLPVVEKNLPHECQEQLQKTINSFKELMKQDDLFHPDNKIAADEIQYFFDEINQWIDEGIIVLPENTADLLKETSTPTPPTSKPAYKNEQTDTKKKREEIVTTEVLSAISQKDLAGNNKEFKNESTSKPAYNFDKKTTSPIPKDLGLEESKQYIYNIVRANFNVPLKKDDLKKHGYNQFIKNIIRAFPNRFGRSTIQGVIERIIDFDKLKAGS
jgi:hypothetical protein